MIHLNFIRTVFHFITVSTLSVFIGSFAVAQTGGASPAEDASKNCKPTTINTSVTVTEGPASTLPPTKLPPESPQTNEGDRLVYFAHGYGGADASWSEARTEMDRRALTSMKRVKATVNETYLSNTGREEAASDYSEALWSAPRCELEGINPENNFMISHSFGGLMGRTLYDRFTQDPTLPHNEYPFQGLITVNTPHLGAPFAENFTEIDDFIGSACENLLAGPLAASVASNPIASVLVNVETPLQLSQVFCGSVVQPFANRILQSYSGDTRIGARTTLHELVPGSPQLESLAQDAVDPVHTLAMFSEENQEDLIWRVLFWAQEPTSEYDFGTANTDGDMATSMRTWENNYTASARTERRTAENLTCTPLQWALPFGTITCHLRARQARHHRSAALAYDQGVRFLQTADARFKWIGGFLKHETIYTPGNDGCDCLVAGITGESGPIWQSIGTSTSSENCYDKCMDRFGPNGRPNTSVITTRFDGANTEIIVVEVPNDGIVPLWSQRGWGVPEFQTQGSNHFQVRNDRNTDRLYSQVLEGNRYRFFNCQE